MFLRGILLCQSFLSVPRLHDQENKESTYSRNKEVGRIKTTMYQWTSSIAHNQVEIFQTHELFKMKCFQDAIAYSR